MASLVPSGETMEVVSTGGREPRIVPRQELAEIVEPRMQEICHLVHRELVRSGFDEFLTAGVVLTGGTVLLEGTVDLCEQIFRMPVRVGYPSGVGGLVDVVNSPAFATGVGLVLYGAREGAHHAFRGNAPGLFQKVRSRMAEWFSAHF